MPGEEELGSKGLGLGLGVGAENMMPRYGPNPQKGLPRQGSWWGVDRKEWSK